MATDIGARIGLDGAADFRRELKLITQQSKELDSEMKALTSSFEANDRSQSSLKAQSEVLGRQIDTQKSKIELLSSQYDKASAELGRLAAELQDATQAYGQNSTQAQKALKAYQNQSTELSKLQTDINKATTALNKMEQEQSRLASEMDDTRSAFDRLNDLASEQQDELNRLKKAYSDLVVEQKDTTDEAQDLAQQISRLSSELSQNRQDMKRAADAADELDRSLDDVEDAADDAGRGMASFGDIVGGNVIADGISGIVDGIKDLHESSIEYRTIMASLENSSERAGYSAKETEESYKTLIGVLGDTQTAATTTANLQAIGLEQGKLKDMINGVIGAWATYGDSIPIDSLAEAVNETINTRTVTGTFADVLNWAKVSEDDFNEILQEANSNTEVANIMLKQLAKQGLVEAGEGWQDMNESLVEYNQASDDLDAALADLGEKSEPLLTELTKLLTGIVTIVTEAGTLLSKDLWEFMPDYEDSLLNLQEIYQNAIYGMNEADLQQLYTWQQKNQEGAFSIEWYREAIGVIEEITGETLLNTEATESNTEALEDSAAASEDVTVNLGEQVVAFQNLSTVMQEKVTEITSAMTSMQEATTNAIQSQMDIFAKFETATTVSKDTVLANMQSQINGFNEWGEQLALLAESTKTSANGMQIAINKDLLQYLASMGPEGAGYIAAFNAMTAEELAQANQLWSQSVNIKNMTTDWGQDLITGVGTIAAGGQQAFADLSSQLNFAANEAGVYTGQGFIEGVQSIVDQAATATEEMGDASILALQEALGVASPSTITREFGRYVDDGLRYGIIDNQAQVAKQAQALAKLVTDTIKNNLPEANTKPAGIAAAKGVQLGLLEGQLSPVQQAASLDRLVIAAINNNISQSSTYSAGLNAAYGLASGIRAGQSAAINAAANMAANALAAARSRLKIHSPSKAFEELGDLSVEGFAVGFDNDEAIRQIERSMSALLSQAAALTQSQTSYAPIESAIRSIPAGSTDIQIVVNAAEGQSAEQIANMVMYKLQHSVNQKKAVWG